jgi:hypothetical protein
MGVLDYVELKACCYSQKRRAYNVLAMHKELREGRHQERNQNTHGY